MDMLIEKSLLLQIAKMGIQTVLKVETVFTASCLDSIFFKFPGKEFFNSQE